MSIHQEVARHIERLPKGTPFFAQQFAPLGSREAIDCALSRLVRQGEINRVARGIYARPNKHALLGEVSVPEEEVVQLLAQQTGARIQIAGAAALNLLGISQQVPLSSHYYTDGRPHCIMRGNQKWACAASG